MFEVAFHWKPDPDKFDCRRQIWYIQAATCSKEVVILIDNSGTMYGMRNTIAQLTVDSLLQTFSNNDYINIFRLFEDNVTALVPCFEDTLIQVISVFQIIPVLYCRMQWRTSSREGGSTQGQKRTCETI